jgi:hypothetical protein
MACSKSGGRARGGGIFQAGAEDVEAADLVNDGSEETDFGRLPGSATTSPETSKKCTIHTKNSSSSDSSNNNSEAVVRHSEDAEKSNNGNNGSSKLSRATVARRSSSGEDDATGGDVWGEGASNVGRLKSGGSFSPGKQSEGYEDKAVERPKIWV